MSHNPRLLGHETEVTEGECRRPCFHSSGHFLVKTRRVFYGIVFQISLIRCIMN